MLVFYWTHKQNSGSSFHQSFIYSYSKPVFNFIHCSAAIYLCYTILHSRCSSLSSASSFVYRRCSRYWIISSISERTLQRIWHPSIHGNRDMAHTKLWPAHTLDIICRHKVQSQLCDCVSTVTSLNHRKSDVTSLVTMNVGLWQLLSMLIGYSLLLSIFRYSYRPGCDSHQECESHSDELYNKVDCIWNLCLSLGSFVCGPCSLCAVVRRTWNVWKWRSLLAQVKGLWRTYLVERDTKRHSITSLYSNWMHVIC